VIVASSMKCMNGRRYEGGEDRNPLAIFSHAGELNHAVDQGEQGMILPDPYVVSRGGSRSPAAG